MGRRLISRLADIVRGVGKVAVLGTALYNAGSALAQTVYVGTELPRKTMVAGDGRTHTVEVYVDNTENEPEGVSGTTWEVRLNPSHFENVFVSVPDNPSSTEGDFWKDISLLFNTLDPDAGEDGWLRPNARGPRDTGQPYAHGKGFLEEILFTVKPDISKTWSIYTQGWAVYDESNNPYPVFIDSDTYRILSPSELSPCDLVGNPGDPRDTHPELPDGDVDLHDYVVFAQEMTGPVIPRVGSEFDFNGDGYVDLRDYAIFQTAFSGDDVPATN